MKKVLVTGGLGYIGAHTSVELLAKGYEVVIVDNLCNTNIEVLQGIEEISGVLPKFYQCDVTDNAAFRAVFEAEKNIQSVIHFAAFKAVGESVEKPLAYYKNNVGGLVTLLELMREFGIKDIIFSSSCTVYGDTDQSPITEDAAIQGAASPYGNTKIIGEQILRDSASQGYFKVMSLRYFNPVGAHPSALIGELPIGIPNNLLPYLTQTAAGIRQELTVFGNDYNTPDGSCIRDYIHVVDIAKAHVLSMEYLINSKVNWEVLNLGTGKGNSVLEVVEGFERVTGVKVNYKIGPRRPGDVVQIWAATEKAEKTIGWKATLTLDDMLSSAWKWQKQLTNMG